MAEAPHGSSVPVVETTPTTDAASTGALIGRASEQLSDLVRTEMELARTQMSEAAKRAGIGAGLFGAAGVFAVYAGGAAVAAAIAAIALVLDLWLAALIVTLVLLAVAGVAALVGKGQVAKAPPTVQRSVDSVKQDVETIKGGDSA